MASITIVQKNKSKGIKTWYARVPDVNGVHFYSLGTTVKTEAKELLQERIKRGAYELKDEKESMTLGEAAVKYEAWQRSKGTKPASIDILLQSVNMLDSLFGCVVSQITIKDISEAFMAEAEGLKASTYRARKTNLSTFFKYMVDVLEILPSNPIAKAIPRRKAVKPQRFFWTQEQIDLILSNAPTPMHRLFWSFQAFAGLRKTEALRMDLSKIHDGSIHLRGKGDKVASIPISPRLQREIDRVPAPWKFTFSNNVLIHACTRALPEGFPGKAHIHRFRHSFGSNLIRAGVNIKVVQTLMRHENITLTLDIYGHILDSDPREAVDKVFK